MHRKLTIVQRGALIAFVLLCSTAVAFATGTVEDVREDPLRRFIPELNHHNDVRASELFGTPVTIDDRSEAATVEDIIVDIGQGHLLYLVIRFTDDTYRDPNSLFPVPLYLFEPQEEQLVLYADNDTFIENMPTIEQVDAYDPDQDEAWGRWMYSFWNIYPGVSVDDFDEAQLDEEQLEDSIYREDRLWSYRYNYSGGPQVVPVALLRGTELIGFDISDYEGDSIGEISDLVVSVENGQLLLVSMEPASALEAQASTYLVPLSAFSANRQTGTIVFDTQEYELPQSVAFEDEWPEISERGIHDRIAENWGDQGVGIRYGAGMQVLPRRLVSDTIIDNYEVFTRDSESLGNIEDLLIRKDGTIVYSTFAYNEVWEIDWEDQTSIVPLSLLTIQPISQAAVLGARAPEIDSMPKFDDGLVVDTSAANWDEAVKVYWNNLYAVERGNQSVGEIPTVDSWNEIGDTDYLFASAIRDFAVVDPNGEWIGEVEQIAMDMVRAEVAYLRLEVDESGLFASAEVAVPVSALEFNPSEEQLVLDATQERLRGAPGYDEIPIEAGRDFLQQVQDYWRN